MGSSEHLQLAAHFRPDPYRRFNPIRQAHRFDPDGAYVRRFVPELAPLEGRAIHEPWKADPAERERLDYPEPLVPPPN